jgi:putative transcription factor
MAGSVTDWDSKTVIGSKNRAPGVVRSESALNAARRSGAAIATDRKTTGGNSSNSGPDHQRIAKLDRENDVAPPAKVAPSVGKAMAQARQGLKMSQKDLAAKTNEPTSVVNDYEAGRAVPSPQVLSKFERILKVKLRGADIGSPLGGPKKK